MNDTKTENTVHKPARTSNGMGNADPDPSPGGASKTIAYTVTEVVDKGETKSS